MFFCLFLICHTSKWEINIPICLANFSGLKARKLGSPVRIFTNIPLDKFLLPKEEGYWLCKDCMKWSSKENKHCPYCSFCTSKVKISSFFSIFVLVSPLQCSKDIFISISIKIIFAIFCYAPINILLFRMVVHMFTVLNARNVLNHRGSIVKHVNVAAWLATFANHLNLLTSATDVGNTDTRNITVH